MPLPSSLRVRLEATVAGVVSLSLWLLTRHVWAAITAAVFSLLALLAWFLPRWHAPVHRLLQRGARAVAVGFSWFVLALVYFGVFTPIRCWRALRGHAALALGPDSTQATYLADLPRSAPRFDRQF